MCLFKNNTCIYKVLINNKIILVLIKVVLNNKLMTKITTAGDQIYNLPS